MKLAIQARLYCSSEAVPLRENPDELQVSFEIFAISNMDIDNNVDALVVIDLRGNWEISHRDVQNHRFITMVQNSRELVASSHDDDYASSTARSIMYCRIVALIVSFF